MEYSKLGRTETKVSRICLGTMTFGQQNTEAQAHEQLDYAVERGINFFDTAELYPIPPMAETRGLTEAYIGSWLKGRQDRDRLVIASKIAGRSGMDWFREGGEQTRLSKAQIDFALERSLKALQTDYIDLYQLHWPDRPREVFGFHSFRDFGIEDMIPFEETLEALARHVEAGRIRHIGLSNESAWGVMTFLHLAEERGWPRMVSIQNVYNLVSRRFDYDLAEIALREDIGLLAYSPLAQGFLSGKYRGGARPENARATLFGRMQRYEGDGAQEAIDAAEDLAHALGITPVQLALKFVDTRPFTTATIIGATTMEQLKADIDAFDIEWTDEMEKAVHKFHCHYRSPCP
ncbi:MAG TPA: aldo/keto reductase [Hellea balneolensis]|uniref:Aldo/keto reductase n=1 Tax=Hellea balneolensis TaxID=287478 RepID=A0A7V5NWL1_9PROT|nr:aldo/keto reductase [Hellea balneolensis]